MSSEAAGWKHIKFDQFSIKNRALGIGLAGLPIWKITKPSFLLCTFLYSWYVWTPTPQVYFVFFVFWHAPQAGRGALRVHSVKIKKYKTYHVKKGWGVQTYQTYEKMKITVWWSSMAASQPAQAQGHALRLHSVSKYQTYKEYNIKVRGRCPDIPTWQNKNKIRIRLRWSSMEDTILNGKVIKFNMNPAWSLRAHYLIDS